MLRLGARAVVPGVGAVVLTCRGGAVGLLCMPPAMVRAVVVDVVAVARGILVRV